MKRYLISTAAIAALLGGCSVYQPVRDTTQPMKFQKSALTGDNAEWYTLTTVIEAPFEAGHTFPGEAGQMEKIRWVIEKGYLYAYRTTEFVVGSEFADAQDDFLGEPVAAFRIEGHFDIWRQYNPVTGEEMPILYESMERPWWEREWMRVDWSTNHIRGFSWMFSEFCKMDGSIVSDPVAYYPTQPDDPEQFYVAQRNGDGSWTNVYGWENIEELDRFDYLDVVNREFVHLNPMSVSYDCIDIDAIPWGGGMQITYRRSFLKKEDSEFKPVHHPDASFEKFGYFRTERPVHHPERGVNDFNINYANIWNIFQNRYAADGTENPVSQWRVKPIVYYHIPTARLPSTQACERTGQACIGYINDDLYYEIAELWNEGFRDVLRAVGHPESETADIFTTAPIDYTCGPTGDRACQNLGDLRYSFMYNHDLDNSNSPLGYGPSWTDPETGEIIAANANFYGGILRLYSGRVGDYYDLIKGNTSELEIMTGENIREMFESMGGVMLPPRLPRVDLEALQATRVAAEDGRLDPTRTANLKFDSLQLRENLKELKRRGPSAWSLRDRILGTWAEKDLITPEMLAMHGLPAGTQLTEDVLEQVSPLRKVSRWRRSADDWFDFWAKKSVYRAEGLYEDVAMERQIERAEESLTAAGEEPNKRNVVDWILRETFRGVESHEVGHTVGLRHNFQGSFDEENYRPEYWEIQETLPDIEFGTLGDSGISSPYDADGDGVLDATEIAAYEADHITRKREQEAAGLDFYTFSSIMDYSPNYWYNDTVGISRYDVAALKFAYGNSIELYSNDQAAFDSAAVTAAGGWDSFRFQKRNRVNVEYYLGGERCNATSECPYSDHPTVRQRCRSELGRGDVLADASPGTPEDLGVCTGIYAELEIMKRAGNINYPEYDFCSDERRRDKPFCNIWDEGKSAQEIVENFQEAYERNYIFNNFRRYRGESFQPYFYYSRIWGTYMRPMKTIYQALLYNYYYEDGYAENLGAGGFLDSFLASRNTLNFFAKVMATPDVGSYLKWDPADVYYDGAYTEDHASWADLYVPVGMGKHLYSTFEEGYYGQIWRFARIGNFFDKLFALEALTSRETPMPDANDETFPINYYDAFQNELLSLFGGIIADDMPAYAPVIRQVDTEGVVERIEYRDLWQGGFFGTTTDEFSGLEAVAGNPVPYDTRYGGEVLDAGGSIYLRIYGLLYALIDFPVFFDSNFPAYVQLYNYGRPSARDTQAIADGEAAGDLIAFTSPDRDMTYVVPQTMGDRSLFWRVVEKAKEESDKLESYRAMAAGAGAPAGFAADNQVCGKVYGINPADAGADDECLTVLLDRQESRLESNESYLRIALDYLNILDYATQ